MEQKRGEMISGVVWMSYIVSLLGDGCMIREGILGVIGDIIVNETEYVIVLAL